MTWHVLLHMQARFLLEEPGLEHSTSSNPQVKCFKVNSLLTGSLNSRKSCGLLVFLTIHHFMDSYSLGGLPASRPFLWQK
jgi:hypothetical protein